MCLEIMYINLGVAKIIALGCTLKAAGAHMQPPAGMSDIVMAFPGTTSERRSRVKQISDKFDIGFRNGGLGYY